MQVQLEVSHHKANVKKVVLRSDTTIGRSAECNLRIASNQVSRQHCMILLGESDVRVRDLGSSNGTHVNGRQIEPNTDVRIASGTRLSIGGVNFVVRFDAPAAEQGSTAELPALANGAAAARARAKNGATNGTGAVADASPALPAAGREGDRPFLSSDSAIDSDDEELSSERGGAAGPALADTIFFRPEGEETVSEHPEPVEAAAADPSGAELEASPPDAELEDGTDDFEEEPAVGKRSRLRSLFSLFRRRPEPEEEELEADRQESAEFEEEPPETILEPADSTEPSPREIEIVPPAASDEGPPAEDEATVFPGESADDDASPPPSGEQDEELGDFLKRLDGE